MNHYDVLGIGNPMLDVLVQVTDEFVAGLGLEKGNFTLVDRARSAEVYQQISHLNLEVEAGDATGNCIAVVANLGGRVGYAGRIGDDEHGRILIEKTKAGGMTSLLSVHPDVPTGLVISLVTPDSQRTFATCLGAAMTLGVADLPSSDLAATRMLHFTGYQLDDPGLREVALEAIRIARANGVSVSVDVADPGVVERNRDLMLELVKRDVDVVFLNEKEGEAFSGEADEEKALAKIAPLADTVCLKLGARGSLISHKGEVHRIAPVPVKAVDTTGAGDSYAGGVLYALLKGLSPAEAGQVGSHVAAHIVSIMGARAKVPLKTLIPEELRAKLG